MSKSDPTLSPGAESTQRRSEGSAPLVLHAPDRPGLFQLHAVDATGGVIEAMRGAQQPQPGEVISFRVADLAFGPVRLVAKVFGPIHMSHRPGQHHSVQWIALTTTERPEFLFTILDRFGIKTHAVRLPAFIPDGRELIFDARTQSVHMVALGSASKMDAPPRLPTTELYRGDVPLAHTQPHILVEAIRTPPTPVEAAPLDPPRHPPADRSQATPTSPPAPAPDTPRQRVQTPSTPMPEGKRPEFPRSPAMGEVRIGKLTRPTMIDSIGQRTLSFVLLDRLVELGTPVAVGVPADPIQQELIWIRGTIESYSTTDGCRYTIRLRQTPPVYRQLVQYWSRRRISGRHDKA